MIVALPCNFFFFKKSRRCIALFENIKGWRSEDFLYNGHGIVSELESVRKQSVRMRAVNVDQKSYFCFTPFCHHDLRWKKLLSP